MRPRITLLAAGLRRRCPVCGEGRLYESYLKVNRRCPACGLDLASHDSGDGPAVFVIMIVGFVVVGLALMVEVTLAPPLWLHLAVWIPLILALALALLPPLKAGLIALHYRHDLLREEARPRH